VEAAWAAGLTVVVASGNDGPGTVTSPGTSWRALTVGATDHRGTASPDDDAVASWSGSDAKRNKPEVVAPGTSLISLRAPGSVVDRANVDNQIQQAQGSGYFVGSGTSMATALAAGAAAVVLAAHPDAAPGDVKSALVDTAVPLAGGGATIDLERATTLPASSAAPPPPGNGSAGRTRASDRDAAGWAGARWTGARWTDAEWAGARWTGARWTEAEWAGARWTGARWTGARWTDSEWAGARWTGARWTGARWTGARWTGARWTGARWTMTAAGYCGDHP
jgi:serine protease AprX